MTFTSKAQFAVHIRTHSAGQNYECNICGRTFIRDSYLIRYILIVGISKTKKPILQLSIVINHRHHNRVHRDNRTTANSIATINSVASGELGSAINAANETGNVYDSATGQVCDLR